MLTTTTTTVTSVMAPHTLPLEIWLEISSYLGDEDIWCLHGVDRLLTSIALDARYRRLYIGLRPFNSLEEKYRGSVLISRIRYVNSAHSIMQDQIYADCPTFPLEFDTSSSGTGKPPCSP